MEYIDHFYLALLKAIQEARVHVSLFLPMITETDLTTQYGFLWKRKSLLSTLKSFNKQPYGILELFLINESLLKKFSSASFYQNRMNIRICTDFEFIKPLTAFAEGFAVIDGKDVYVQPDAQNSTNGSFAFINNQNRALYFQGLFSQISQHEQQMDNYQPTSSFLNLVPTEKSIKEMLNYFYEIQSHRVVDILPKNPFLNRLIKKYTGE